MRNKHEVSDRELKSVIADFLEMGHIENIIAMFRHEPRYYAWTGELLRDERFNVRLGIAVLFEELKIVQPEELEKALESLLPLLEDENPLLRGEAVSLLGVIGTKDAKKHIHSKSNDPNPQVREMVELVLSE